MHSFLTRIFKFLPQRHKKNKVVHISALPIDLTYTLFTYMPAQEFLHLCQTSIQMRSKIRAYLYTSLFVRHFNNSLTAILANKSLSSEAKQSQTKETFAAFGRVIHQCFPKENQECGEFVAKLHTKCSLTLRSDYKGWGALFNEITSEWPQSDELAFIRAYFIITGELENALRILQSFNDPNEDGQLDFERIRLRYLIYGSFLRTSLCNFCRFRFAAILHIFGELAPNADLKLILLLGTPIGKRDGGSEFIDFEEIHSKVVFNHESMQSSIGTMPALVVELASTNTPDFELIELRWSELRIFNLIENLTTFPEPWTLSAFSAFLISSPTLTRLAIVTRTVHGNVTEAGFTLFHCIECAVNLKYTTWGCFHPTIQSLLKHCQPIVCLSVIREAFTCVHHHFMFEAIPPELVENPHEINIPLIRHSIEINAFLADFGKTLVG